MEAFLKKLQKIPAGYSKVIFNHKVYGLTRSNFNKGKSIKVYARELGGNNFISFNYYTIKGKGVVKPCEMSLQKVTYFMENIIIQRAAL